LDTVLRRMADVEIERETLIEREKSIGRRSIAIFIVANVLLIYLLLWSLPAIETISFGISMLLMRSIENFMDGVWSMYELRQVVVVFYFALVIFVVGMVLASKLLCGITPVRAVRDRIVLWSPGIGQVARSIAMMQFTGIAGALLDGGIPLLQSLGIAQKEVSNRALSGTFNKALARVGAGMTTSEALRESGVFPPTTVSIIAAGEQAGSLGPTFLKVADSCDAELEFGIRRALRMLIAAIAVFAGIVIMLALVGILFSFGGCPPGG
ncbi:MAG: type II secretion system F family protein, partial [Candidatus Lindowbacteria bacterium]|nr:type II secretion system F family protein [Candidatus Lindowbacteria bacterium]